MHWCKLTTFDCQVNKSCNRVRAFTSKLVECHAHIKFKLPLLVDGAYYQKIFTLTGGLIVAPLQSHLHLACLSRRQLLTAERNDEKIVAAKGNEEEGGGAPADCHRSSKCRCRTRIDE
ncbi:hypothetical protein V7S43_002205 [Phytophthora oleae]|uniref:Uncharacterized protein n=1 Tax=Phytophthora oleae TaxID=2107226 RepID=A0ABD3G168_9STRA